MKSTLRLLVGLCVPIASLLAAEPAPLNDALLSRLRAEAIRSHPAVAAARLKTGAATRDVRAVRLWDDPMVGLMFMGAEKEMRMDDGDIRVMLEQPLPKPGLFQANRAKADAMRRAEGENSRTAGLVAGAMAAKDVIELALADESFERPAWMRSAWKANSPARSRC